MSGAWERLRKISFNPKTGQNSHFLSQKLRRLKKNFVIGLLWYNRYFRLPNLVRRLILSSLHLRKVPPPTQIKIEMEICISEVPRNLTKIFTLVDSEWSIYSGTDFSSDQIIHKKVMAIFYSGIDSIYTV